MEKKQIQIYCEAMHKFYLDSANCYLKDHENYKNSSESLLAKHCLDKAKEKTAKARAIMKVLEFINC